MSLEYANGIGPWNTKDGKRMFKSSYMRASGNYGKDQRLSDRIESEVLLQAAVLLQCSTLAITAVETPGAGGCIQRGSILDS